MLISPAGAVLAFLQPVYIQRPVRIPSDAAVWWRCTCQVQACLILPDCSASCWILLWVEPAGGADPAHGVSYPRPPLPDPGKLSVFFGKDHRILKSYGKVLRSGLNDVE